MENRGSGSKSQLYLVYLGSAEIIRYDERKATCSMSDSNDLLEKVEPEKHWLERVGDNKKLKGLETIAKIGGFLFVIASAVIGYLSGLPIYLYVPLATLFFC